MSTKCNDLTQTSSRRRICTKIFRRKSTCDLKKTTDNHSHRKLYHDNLSRYRFITTLPSPIVLFYWFVIIKKYFFFYKLLNKSANRTRESFSVVFCNQTSKIAFKAHRFKPAWATEQLSIRAAWAEIPHASEQTAQKILLRSAPLGITFPPLITGPPTLSKHPPQLCPFQFAEI